MRLVGGNRDPASGVSVVVGGRPLPEQQLIDRARGGDVRAYEDLVRLHQQLAFRTAYLLVGSAADAEDAVQVAFLKAWKSLARFRPGAPFRPWLLAIVANEARTHRRAASRRHAWTERVADQADSPGEAQAPSADVAVLATERRAVLLSALLALSERDRIAIELRYLLDLSEHEMAVVLGCRRGTVKSRLSRALDRLREQIGEEP